MRRLIPPDLRAQIENASWERYFSSLLVVTQNIDRLHQRAGLLLEGSAGSILPALTREIAAWRSPT